VGPAPAHARALDIEVWTGRGDDSVYEPGDLLEVRARASDDAYLLVYEIDAEGRVRLLSPFRGSSGFVEGRRTYTVPPERSNVELVVQDGPVGQCYVVAIASRDRFRDLPWYLRPYDIQAEEVGYEGMPDDEEGITAEGRIVGDPFVVMEKIRRRVLLRPNDASAFATGYATYYVHEEVRYPRYLCYDCHRPGRWTWWTGFDPYYTHCSVFDFRINWSWGWGPAYWFGTVPYYYYIVRADCPPHYRPWIGRRHNFSSWDGWRRWRSLWGEDLVRYKMDPPAGYVPPSRFPDRRTWKDARTTPPGIVVPNVRKGREGFQPRMVTGRGYESVPREREPREEGTVRERPGGTTGRPQATPAPGREVTDRREGGRGTTPRPSEETRERGATPRPREVAPRQEKPREETPSEEKPRQDRSPRIERKPDPAPAGRPSGGRGNEARGTADDRGRASGGQRTSGW
jgi:hypothetical protein